MLDRRDLLGAFPAYALLAELGSSHARRRTRSTRSWLDPAGPDYQIQPVDPLGGTDLGDGTLRAPFLAFEESARRYARG